VSEAVWELALARLWEEGTVRPRGPDELVWTVDNALADARALRVGRDRPEAFARWVVGSAAWDRAQAQTTGWAAGELPSGPRRALLRAWVAAAGWAERLSLTWPIERWCRITSRFGPRLHPVLGRLHEHRGIDLGVPVGTPVVAAQAGRVRSVGESRSSGRYVVVDHGDGLVTRYYHLDAAEVVRGALVGRGERIGTSGASGRVTGPHLHFEVELGGRRVDPGTWRPERPRS
jgi:murein DD-endopeptidase MepM/ murein hydrolase activator NlpD